MDVGAVLVRIHAEIAEVAPLAAERDVEIESQLSIWIGGGTVEHTVGIANVFLGPERVRRIVGDEDTPYLGLGPLFARRCGIWIGGWTVQRVCAPKQ